MKNYIITITALMTIGSFVAQENLGVNQSNPTAKTHITNTQNQNSFRVDDEAGDATPFVIDSLGNTRVGARLITDSLTISTGASDGAILQSDANGNAEWNEINIGVFQDRSVGNAGVNIAGWQTRELNFTQKNIGSKISVNYTNNEITIEAGVYKIRVSSCGYQVGRHQIKLTEIGTNLTLALGSNEYTIPSSGDQTKSSIDNIIEVTSETTFIIEHFMDAVFGGSSGLGVGVTSGESNVYTTIYIEKIK
jgi:hypothetical protein